MKKLFSILIFACCMALTFAQSIYKLDLAGPFVGYDSKTSAFDKKTGTVTINRHGDLKADAGISYWLNNMDVSAYNIIRIKYEAKGNTGFQVYVSFDDASVRWNEKGVYCPSYLNEMVFPITAYPKKIDSLYFEGAWNTDYEQFVLKEVTFEKVDNPVKTNVNGIDNKPVVDTATKTTIDAKYNAWDFVLKLGTGYSYSPFMASSITLDFGADIYALSTYNKADTRKHLQNIRKKGFQTIRVQVCPGNHFIDDKYTLDSRYVNELKEFIDIAMEEDLYVVIVGFFWAWEIRHADELNRVNPVRYESVVVNEKEQKRSEAVLKAFWTQIATAFNNSYDEHLIFETMNEPIDDLHPQVEGHNGQVDLNCAVCKSDIKIGNGYNQLIVDAIRSTGGNNANRFIMIGAFGWPYSSYFKMPKDKAKNKLIPITHIYPMGVENAETMFYTDGLKNAAIIKEFELMDKYFFKKKIPVYVTETGAPRIVPVMEKINMMKDFIAEATKPGRSCSIILWADDSCDSQSHDFYYYDINTEKWAQEEYINSVLYAAQGKEYKLSDDFVKANEIKIESIVGKELLAAPVKIEDWDAQCINKFARAVPSKYKLELVVEKTGPDPKLSLNYIDADKNWRYVIPEKKKIQGGTLNLYNNDTSYEIIPKEEKIVIGITEAYSPYIEYLGLYINGTNILLKSVKVVE